MPGRPADFTEKRFWIGPVGRQLCVRDRARRKDGYAGRKLVTTDNLFFVFLTTAS
jgi:hypothetical protein